MNEISSAKFRTTYASLKEPVVVTVNGHPIGTYQPIMSTIDARAVEQIRPGEPKLPERYDQRPIRPVPKQGR